ncbi:MAG: hypothetical protein ACRBCJ_13595 [Hyphomicrobiaceae bacterium]
MANHIYEAVLAGRTYLLASNVDLGPDVFMGFIRTLDGWEAKVLARKKPQHSSAITYVSSRRIS